MNDEQSTTNPQVTSDNIQSITCQTDNCNQVFTDINAFEEHVTTGHQEHLEMKPKHPGGRPCKFCEHREEYMTKTNAYLEKCKKGVNGKPIIPYIEELALELNTLDTNIVNWVNKMTPENEREHEEFFAAYSTVKMIQKLRLQQRALGRYQPVGAIKLLQFNHGMMETSKQVIAGDANEPLEIIITEEDRKKDGE